MGEEDRLEMKSLVPGIYEVLRHADGLRCASDGDQSIASIPFITCNLYLRPTAHSAKEITLKGREAGRGERQGAHLYIPNLVNLCPFSSDDTPDQLQEKIEVTS